MTEPRTARDIAYWRRQLVSRNVDATLPWPDGDVMVVVGNLVSAYDEAIAAERARLLAAWAEAVALGYVMGIATADNVVRSLLEPQP